LAAEVIAIGATVPGIREIRLAPNCDYLQVDIVAAGEDEVIRMPLDHLATVIGSATGSERSDLIGNRLAAAVERVADKAAGQSWDTARLLLLRTTLRPTSWQARHPGSHVGIEVLPGVAEIAVLDRPSSMENVSLEMLAQWNVTAAEVLASARDNLDQAPEPGHWQKLDTLPLYELADANEYSASRLIRPEWLQQHSPPGTGPVIVMMPSLGMIIAGRLPAVQPFLAPISQQTTTIWREATDQISPVIYLLQDDAMTPLRLPTDKAADVLRVAELMLAATEYHRQNTLQQRAGGQPQAQLTVTSMDGHPASLASWNGTTTDDLLPRADFVAVATTSSTIAIVDWDTFLRTTPGHIRREADVMPGRWRTVTPLTADRREELARHAVQRHERR